MFTSYIIPSLIGVTAVSLISLIGLFIVSFKETWLKKYIFVFISLAVGALLGDSFIHLIPESFANSSNHLSASLLIITGVILFFILEKFLHWHHHGEDSDDNEIHPMGKLVLFSDGVHNFIDGIIIGMSFIISLPVGIATTIAVILHEIPQEIGDFAVLLHAGYSKKRALLLNFFSAIVSFAGLGLVFILGNISSQVTALATPIAAGGFLYIAVADLIPELHKTKEANHSLLQIISLIVGIILMLGLTLLE